jgi:hypothetical protein
MNAIKPKLQSTSRKTQQVCPILRVFCIDLYFVARLAQCLEITMYETLGEPDPPDEVDQRPLLDSIFSTKYSIS